MNQRFNTTEVMRALGTAPSTAGVIAGLLSGTVDPDNFRSVEVWALANLDAPPQHKKVLAAIAELLDLENGDMRVTYDFEGSELWYLAGFGGQPTVTWHKGNFELRTVEI